MSVEESHIRGIVACEDADTCDAEKDTGKEGGAPFCESRLTCEWKKLTSK